MTLDTAAPDESAASPEPATPPAAGRRPSVVRWSTLAPVLGVLVPLAVLTIYALKIAPSFDGSMNLQIAQNISDGDGYVRFYGGTVPFPAEIQTSGVYIFLSAGFLSVLGHSWFAYQLTNLLFMALLLAAVAYGLRGKPVLQLLAPAVVTFGVAGTVEFSMSGYGEYVVAALVFTAFVLVGAVASGSRRAVLLVGLAGLAVGAAFTVKFVAALAVPVLLAGLVLTLLARRNVSWWRVLLSGAVGVAIPVVAVEAQRYFSLGSFSAWKSYWSAQLNAVGAQAGVSNQAGGSIAGASTSTAGPPSPGLLQTVADHLHLLSRPPSNGTGIPAEFLVLMLGLPFVVLLVLFVFRRMSWRSWLALPHTVLALMLASYGGGYLIWWLAITPTSKAWLRRVVIALMAIAFLAMLLIGMSRDAWRRRTAAPEAPAPGLGERRAAGAARRRVLAARTGIGVLLVLGFVCALPVVSTARSQLLSMVEANTLGRNQISALAGEAAELSAEGNVMYGVGWWSAPVVALKADIPLQNLYGTDVCDPATGIPSGHAYIIWDFYATQLATSGQYPKAPTGPSSSVATFTLVPGSRNPQGSIWKIEPAPGKCKS